MNALCRVFLFALPALCCCLPLGAVELAPNYEEGSKLVGKDGYVIIAYADGWDAFSRDICKKLLAEPAIHRAAGDAVLIPLGIPGTPDEARRAQMATICGKLELPAPPSVPALVFYDREERHYATFSGSEMSRGDVPAIARELKALLKKGRKRARLLAEAETLTGAEAADKLSQAYQIKGLSGMPGAVRERIATLDPEDRSGAVRADRFNSCDLSVRFDGMTESESIAETNRMLADEAYSDRQRQLMCAALLGALRRKGTTNAEAVRHYAERMREYAPDTLEGKSATYVLREWSPGFYYARGWNPSSIPGKPGPVELKGKLPISEAGTYEVSLERTRGQVGLRVNVVELYDGEKKVAEDCYDNERAGRYILKVPGQVVNPRLLMTIKPDLYANPYKRMTYGQVYIRKVK